MVKKLAGKAAGAASKAAKTAAKEAAGASNETSLMKPRNRSRMQQRKKSLHFQNPSKQRPRQRSEMLSKNKSKRMLKRKSLARSDHPAWTPVSNVESRNNASLLINQSTTSLGTLAQRTSITASSSYTVESIFAV